MNKRTPNLSFGVQELGRKTYYFKVKTRFPQPVK